MLLGVSACSWKLLRLPDRPGRSCALVAHHVHHQVTISMLTVRPPRWRARIARLTLLSGRSIEQVTPGVTRRILSYRGRPGHVQDGIGDHLLTRVRLDSIEKDLAAAMQRDHVAMAAGISNSFFVSNL